MGDTQKPQLPQTTISEKPKKSKKLLKKPKVSAQKISRKSKVSEQIAFLKSVEKEIKFWKSLLQKVKNKKSLQKDKLAYERICLTLGKFVGGIIEVLETHAQGGHSTPSRSLEEDLAMRLMGVSGDARPRQGRYVEATEEQGVIQKKKNVSVIVAD